MNHSHEGTMIWHVYMLLCSDHSIYTGITTDIDRRIVQHATGRGAKYFRGRRPLRLLYLEREHTRSSAGRREAELKALSRAEKEHIALAAPEVPNLPQRQVEHGKAWLHPLLKTGER